MTAARLTRARELVVLLALAITVFLVRCSPRPQGPDADAEPHEQFASRLKAISDELTREETQVYRGQDGWLFYGPELRSLSVGPFWGQHAAKVSEALDLDHADPLPAILDFNAQLRDAGIRLIFVLAPAKACVYPEAVMPDLANGEPIRRLDHSIEEFLGILAQQGVEVLDLLPAFLEARTDDGPNLFCKQDTHWSPRACAVAAHLIADRLRDEPWLEQVPRIEFTTHTITKEITGDLWKWLGDETLPRETLSVTVVSSTPGEDDDGSTTSRDGPIVLLGDSSCLAFHQGAGMLVKQAGLPDLLAAELGIPIDLAAVLLFGATYSRMNLVRRNDNLAGKRVVIWCVAARALTESRDGWQILPVIQAQSR
jgi:acetyltransferase AlgX (SGNH hydrolase-like protein)